MRTIQQLIGPTSIRSRLPSAVSLLLKQRTNCEMKHRLQHRRTATNSSNAMIDSKGRRTIGPRPELVAEIGDKAGVRSFYMYTSERFIEYAGRYLNLRVRPETLSQVRDVADVRRQEDESKPLISVISAVGAVMAYLSRVKPEYQFAVSALDTVFDLIGTQLKTGALIGVEVGYSSMFTRGMFDRITTRVFDYAQNETSFEEIIIIFTHEGNRHVDRTIRAIRSLSNIPPRVSFLVGVISVKDESPLFVARYERR